MSPEQFAALIAELAGIKLALYGTSALMVIAVVFAGVRTYFTARHQIDRQLEDLFRQEAEILFEKNELDELVLRCRAMLAERPNHAYARWYLGRSLSLQGKWGSALEEFTVLKGKFPNWASSIDPFAKEATRKLQCSADDLADADSATARIETPRP